MSNVKGEERRQRYRERRGVYGRRFTIVDLPFAFKDITVDKTITKAKPPAVHKHPTMEWMD